VVAFVPSDAVLVNIGAGIKIASVLAAGARLAPTFNQDKDALAPFGIAPDDLQQIEDQLKELKVMTTDPKIKKNDTPVQMAEVAELMARIRAWLWTLRLMGSVNLGGDTPALARIASSAPEVIEGYPRDLLHELERRIQAANDLRPRLEECGLTESFVGRGSRLLSQLKTAIGVSDVDPANLQLVVRRYYLRKAQAYLGMKRAVRAGQLAFMMIPDRAQRYHLDEVEPRILEAPPKAQKPRS
jgi:hypothetical protein